MEQKTLTDYFSAKKSLRVAQKQTSIASFLGDGGSGKPSKTSDFTAKVKKVACVAPISSSTNIQQTFGNTTSAPQPWSARKSVEPVLLELNSDDEDFDFTISTPSVSRKRKNVIRDESDEEDRSRVTRGTSALTSGAPPSLKLQKKMSPVTSQNHVIHGHAHVQSARAPHVAPVVHPKPSDAATSNSQKDDIRLETRQIKSSPSCRLPSKLKCLVQQFEAVDDICALFFKRHAPVMFSELKTSVQNITKQNFKEKHMGQLKTLLPTGYHFKLEKVRSTSARFASKYEIVVEPSFSSDISILMQKTTRKTLFLKQLNEHVTKAHEDFLVNKLGWEAEKIPREITEFHKKFDLETVPDVAAAELPQPPEEPRKCVTAFDILQQCKPSPSKRVQRALQTVAQETQVKASAESVVIEKTQTIEPKTAKESSRLAPALGIPQELLERIRAKQAKADIGDMTRTPAEHTHLARLKRLPELIRIVRGFFVTERKLALPRVNVAQKMAQSYKSFLSPDEANKHVEIMLKILPDWITQVTVSKGQYIKLDKNKDLQKEVIPLINKALQSAQ